MSGEYKPEKIACMHCETERIAANSFRALSLKPPLIVLCVGKVEHSTHENGEPVLFNVGKYGAASDQ